MAQKGFSLRDLAVIGVLAALARALGIMTVFALGGMNPVSLTIRALLITSIFIVLRIKVQRFGTLVLATLVGSLAAFLVMAQGILTLPFMLLAALLAEYFITYVGQNRAWAIIVGTAAMSLLDKMASLTLMYLMSRENPRMLWPILLMVAISSLGDIIAIFVAPRFLKELRHAGFISSAPNNNLMPN
ncbi:MAG: MptD family putative ECF transporter S component [Deltaproteobacteria bacterium]|jgi:hypothetical protein|nr:MptD family putative ECF transporter S component [Deltaproteobacteria bacterium]